jgi:hypothetical protein
MNSVFPQFFEDLSVKSRVCYLREQFKASDIYQQNMEELEQVLAFYSEEETSFDTSKLQFIGLKEKSINTLSRWRRLICKPVNQSLSLLRLTNVESTHKRAKYIHLISIVSYYF